MSEMRIFLMLVFEIPVAFVNSCDMRSIMHYGYRSYWLVPMHELIFLPLLSIPSGEICVDRVVMSVCTLPLYLNIYKYSKTRRNKS